MIQECLIACLIVGALCSSKEETERHLEMGKRMLSAGQLADALSHYHAAVGKLPHLTRGKHWDSLFKVVGAASVSVDFFSSYHARIY